MSDDSKPESSRTPALDAGEFGVETEPGSLRLERVLPGPMERVWAYLTESDKRALWLAPGAMELRVGGSVDMKFRHSELSRDPTLPKDQKNCEVSGKVTRCDPPRLLSYTWNDGSGDRSEVTFELSPRGSNVLLVLTHRRLDDRAHLVGVATGWHTHVGILLDRLNDREPRPFWQTKLQMEAEYQKRLAK